MVYMFTAQIILYALEKPYKVGIFYYPFSPFYKEETEVQKVKCNAQIQEIEL